MITASAFRDQLSSGEKNPNENTILIPMPVKNASKKLTLFLAFVFVFVIVVVIVFVRNQMIIRQGCWADRRRRGRRRMVTIVVTISAISIDQRMSAAIVNDCLPVFRCDIG